MWRQYISHLGTQHIIDITTIRYYLTLYITTIFYRFTYVSPDIIIICVTIVNTNFQQPYVVVEHYIT